jgi:DNA-binding transcriptional LysR family regulator
MIQWQFERDGETLRIDPPGPLLVQVGGAIDLAIETAVAGTGIVYLFEDWLRPYIERGELVPVLESWWPAFSGPYLYYPGRRLLPAPLRAFVDFIRNDLQPQQQQ